MKNGYYQIGEVAQITGLSKDTLHFYEKAGVLRPDHIDPENGYRYYSRWNLWQLDIVAACRKLGVPLEQVRQILACRDNERIVSLLMAYRQEALRLSGYYRQVADDILWYNEENRRIRQQKETSAVEEKYLAEEVVAAGSLKRDAGSYHANLQEAVKDELHRAPSIRRKYGYILDGNALALGRVVKLREYLKLGSGSCQNLPADSLLTLPAGRYAVFTLHIENEKADFSPLLDWLSAHGAEADAIYAEELGLQLFDYVKDYYCEIKAHIRE